MMFSDFIAHQIITASMENAPSKPHEIFVSGWIVIEKNDTK
jgi:hypothetical protein